MLKFIGIQAIYIIHKFAHFIFKIMHFNIPSPHFEYVFFSRRLRRSRRITADLITAKQPITRNHLFKIRSSLAIDLTQSKATEGEVKYIVATLFSS